jgi:acetyl-CoA synthetase
MKASGPVWPKSTSNGKRPFTRTLNEDNAPFYKWFEDGKLNVSYNCLDRNLQNGNADKTAIIFEADDGKSTRVSTRSCTKKSANSPTA